MSSEVHQLLVDKDAHRFVWNNLRRFCNRSLPTPFKLDSPEQCLLGKEYWNAYPENSYTYNFNSWGFRDCDFEQYMKENTDIKVNICIGDSFTMNIGGPAEHSWPYLLSKKLSAPTINVGIDCLSSLHYQNVLTKYRKLLNVDRVFLLYNLYDDSDIPNRIKTAQEIQQNAKLLKHHCWIPGAYWQFVPPWTIFKDELPCVYEHFPEAHNYMRNVNLDWKNIDYQLAMSCQVLANEYQKIAGVDWVNYSKFIELLIIDPNYLFNQFHDAHDQRLIREYLNTHVSKLLLTNRDGWHMSRQVNQALADYFYQSSVTNINNF